MFSGPAPSLTKNHFRTTERADIYRRYKQIQRLKNWSVLQYESLPDKTFQLILFTYPF